MNKLFSIIILFTLVVFVNTKAKCDRFVIGQDTLYLDIEKKSPLEQYEGMPELRKKLEGYGADTRCFDCFPQGYSALWKVIDNELYLTAIESESGSKTYLKADLNILFNVQDNKVKATWVTVDLWLHTNSSILAIPDLMTMLYKSEKQLSIVGGKLISVKDFNYTDAQESIYLRNNRERDKFIYSNINWAKIPNLDIQIKRVSAYCETGTSGRPENIKIYSNGADTIYKQEALRVISILPWSIYYAHGQVFKRVYSIPVIFSEENRKKYAH